MELVTSPHSLSEPTGLTPSQRRRMIILCAVGFVIMVVFWWTVRGTVEFTDFSELHGLWRPALAFILFGATLGFLGLCASLFQTSNIGGMTILLGSVSAFVIFPLTLATLAGCSLIIIAWGRYWAMVSDESLSRIRYSLVKNVTHGLGSTVSLTVLAVALFYLSYANTTNETNDQFINRTTDGAGDAVVRILEKQLPGFNAEMTVDDFLTQYDQDQLSTVVPIEFISQPVNQSLLPEAERLRLVSLDEATRKAALAQARTALLEPLNIKIDGNEHMNTVIRALVGQKLKPVLQKYERYIPPVMALAIFSALSLLGLVYYWWIVGWAAVWYGLIRLLGWNQVREKTVRVHRMMVG